MARYIIKSACHFPRPCEFDGEEYASRGAAMAAMKRRGYSPDKYNKGEWSKLVRDNQFVSSYEYVKIAVVGEPRHKVRL